MIFGIATYDYLIEHLQSHVGRQGWHDYPMFHTHFEHKRLVLHRLRLLSPADGEDPPVQSYERLVTEVDRARLQVLMSERQGKSLPHDLVERFEGFRAAETEILTAWLEELYGHQRCACSCSRKQVQYQLGIPWICEADLIEVIP